MRQMYEQTSIVVLLLSGKGTVLESRNCVQNIGIGYAKIEYSTSIQQLD